MPDPWPRWVAQSYVTTTASTNGGLYDPSFWDFNTTATTSANNWHAWTVWMTNNVATPYYVPSQHSVEDLARYAAFTSREPRAPTVRPQREVDILHRRSRAAALRRRVKNRAAKRAARELLLSQLTPEQREQFLKHEFFDLVLGGKRYRIRRGIAGNLDVLSADGKFVVERWCVHPRVEVPAEDNMLAQKLMLETDMAELRRIANITPMYTVRAA